MSDGHLKITVRNLKREPVDVAIVVDADGYVVLGQLPAPGSLVLDPERDVPDAVDTIAMLGQVGVGLRDERKKR